MRRCLVGGEAAVKQSLPIIRASEIGEYVYCAHARGGYGAWWAAAGGCGERREFGTVLHRRHGRAVAGSRLLLDAGWVAAGCGAAVDRAGALMGVRRSAWALPTLAADRAVGLAATPVLSVCPGHR